MEIDACVRDVYSNRQRGSRLGLNIDVLPHEGDLFQPVSSLTKAT